MRDQVRLAARTNRTRAFEPHVFDDVCGRNRGRRLVGERPPSVLLDADGNGFVWAAVEVFEDRRRRGHSDLALARATAVHHAYTELLHRVTRFTRVIAFRGILP